MNQDKVRYCHSCHSESPATSDRCLHCGSHQTVLTARGSMGWSLGFLDRRTIGLLLALVVFVLLDTRHVPNIVAQASPGESEETIAKLKIRPAASAGVRFHLTGVVLRSPA